MCVSLRFVVLRLVYKGSDHKMEATPGAAKVIMILNSGMPGLDFPSVLSNTIKPGFKNREIDTAFNDKLAFCWHTLKKKKA